MDDLLRDNVYFKDKYSDLFAAVLGGTPKWNFMKPSNSSKIEYTERSNASNGLATGYIQFDDLVHKHLKQWMLKNQYNIQTIDWNLPAEQIVRMAGLVIETNENSISPTNSISQNQVNLDEEIPYTLRKEKRAFDMFLLSVAGIVLIFSIGGFFAYKTFEIIANQDDRINQLEMKISKIENCR